MSIPELTYLPTKLHTKLYYFTADFGSALYILSEECLSLPPIYVLLADLGTEL
jgi:hypothetical protein